MTEKRFKTKRNDTLKFWWSDTISNLIEHIAQVRKEGEGARSKQAGQKLLRKLKTYKTVHLLEMFERAGHQEQLAWTHQPRTHEEDDISPC